MKLGNLLKKELRELLTKQAIFAMIFTCVLLICPIWTAPGSRRI